MKHLSKLTFLLFVLNGLACVAASDGGPIHDFLVEYDQQATGKAEDPAIATNEGTPTDLDSNVATNADTDEGNGFAQRCNIMGEHAWGDCTLSSDTDRFVLDVHYPKGHTCLIAMEAIEEESSPNRFAMQGLVDELEAFSYLGILLSTPEWYDQQLPILATSSQGLIGTGNSFSYMFALTIKSKTGESIDELVARYFTKKDGAVFPIQLRGIDCGETI